MKALDLFCGAGGATRGLQLAGFHVTGIDIRPQRRYCGDLFIQADALRPPVRLADFDFVWASPLCERFTRCWRGQPHRLLLAVGVPFVLENVIGAPLRADLLLTGAMFGLPIVRDRIFECHGFAVPFALAPQHRGTTRRGDLAMVAGGGGAMKGWNRAHWDDPVTRDRLRRRNSVSGWREAMGIDWMDRRTLAKAIPPAYSEFIGCAVASQLRARAA